MGGFKESAITSENDQDVDICDHCGEAIYSGQVVWKVGSEMYCNRSCLESGIQIVTLRV
ncbi:hypothetical protein [Brevibacillus sp. SAFN-007a]|uniref:hypothetical protein n=1 Tax=Brevibacillus sp. SAFN-007a TaxID=3436862 RepID=UPI003F7F5978